MIPAKRIPTHPGEVLRREFLELVNGKRGVTPETAWLLASALETSPELWMNLQVAHDLAKNRLQTPRKAIR